MKYNLYLDDVRTPIHGDWIIVRSYDEFINKIYEIGLINFNVISLDHDLGVDAMIEWKRSENEKDDINYENINEKTGYDCAKFLVELSINDLIPLPQIFVHSFNNVGSDNIVKYINNYLKFNGLPQTCVRAQVEFNLENSYPEI